MEYINVGKIVNTHALKGEVRLISSFEYKTKSFKVGNNLFIGSLKKKVTIESYRVHKQFDMIKFKEYDNINDVIIFKGQNVYVLKSDLELSDEEILIDELINMQVFNNSKEIGKIEEYRCDNGNKMIRVNRKLIPFNKDFITSIDKVNKKVYMHDIEVFL